MKLHRIFLAAFAAAAVAVCGVMLTGCGEGGGRPAKLTFDSFDGGGPEYTAEFEDASVASCASERKYHKPDHDEMTGAGYDVIFNIVGLKPGSTVLTVTSESPIVPREVFRYRVTVDGKLNVAAELLPDETDPAEAVRPVPQMLAVLGDAVYYAAHEDCAEAEELTDKLSSGELVLELAEEDGCYTAELPWPLAGEPRDIQAEAGDIVLLPGDRIALFCSSGAVNGVKLAAVAAQVPEELSQAVEKAGGELRLWVEWSE